MLQDAIDEYSQALKKGLKESRELSAAGKRAHLLVLDEILPENYPGVVQDIGLLEIPSERIIGTKTAGRVSAFSPSFRPLLEPKTEFASKWIALCEYQLGDTGILDPIV